MTSDAIIFVLILVLIYFAIFSRNERFIDLGNDPSGPPTYTSGASMRIDDTSVSDNIGNYWQEFGKREGEYYAKYMNLSRTDRDIVKNPTYGTALTI